MRGINTSAVSGNVGARVNFGVTSENVPHASFDVLIEEKSTKTWARVNVYGPGLVQVCRNRLRVGGYVQIVGRLMTRKRRLEIRAEQIVFGGTPVTTETVP